MADKNSPLLSSDAKAKSDARVDLVAQRLAYCSLAGALCGCVFFKQRVVRWSAMAYGAGFGSGTAVTEWFGSSANLAKPKTSDPPAPASLMNGGNRNEAKTK